MDAFNTPESWKEALRIGSLIGQVPSSFTTCIRFLIRDQTRNNGQMSHASTYCLLRLLSTPTLLAPIYYASLTFKEDKVRSASALPPKVLIRLFTPLELSYLVGFVYLARRIRRGCKIEEWTNLAPSMYIHSDMGGLIGSAIPKISFSFGLLVGTMRHLAMAMFLGIDEKGYVKYRRALKAEDAQFDLAAEQKTWGCTHIQVASVMLQSLGMGVAAATSLNPGLLPGSLDDPLLDSDGYKSRITALWIHCLLRTGKPPDITHKGEYYPLGQELAILQKKTDFIRSNGSTHFWLGRGREDLSAEKTPLLFARVKSQPIAPIETGEDELKKDLSPDELKQIQESGELPEEL